LASRTGTTSSNFWVFSLTLGSISFIYTFNLSRICDISCTFNILLFRISSFYLAFS
jgi:hypothetical protein